VTASLLIINVTTTTTTTRTTAMSLLFDPYRDCVICGTRYENRILALNGQAPLKLPKRAHHVECALNRNNKILAAEIGHGIGIDAWEVIVPDMEWELVDTEAMEAMADTPSATENGAADENGAASTAAAAILTNTVDTNNIDMVENAVETGGSIGKSSLNENELSNKCKLNLSLFIPLFIKNMKPNLRLSSSRYVYVLLELSCTDII
jgi:hypothetical protein